MRYISSACGLLLLCAMAIGCARARESDWTAWSDFTKRFMEPSGRIVDLTFDKKSTSEGQSYALFFALVANDRARFDTILKWTDRNLAKGRLGEQLPAWHWGIGPDGKWKVQDENAASDGDLWIAYALLEAARLWKEPRYAETGRALLRQVQAKEVVEAGAAGTLLLPGPVGFDLGDGRYRVDPSYIPGFQFRYFAHVDPQGPWQKIWDGYVKLAPQVFKAGVAPDLFVVNTSGQVSPDTDRPEGAYDAIRVYMWAGMGGAKGDETLPHLRRFAELIRERGAPPEKVDSATGKPLPGDWSPPGFSAAVLPFLKALGDEAGIEQQRKKLQWARVKDVVKPSTNYYDACLTLFGEGWADGRYRFDEQGRVVPKWAGGA